MVVVVVLLMLPPPLLSGLNTLFLVCECVMKRHVDHTEGVPIAALLAVEAKSAGIDPFGASQELE